VDARDEHAAARLDQHLEGIEQRPPHRLVAARGGVGLADEVFGGAVEDHHVELARLEQSGDVVEAADAHIEPVAQAIETTWQRLTASIRMGPPQRQRVSRASRPPSRYRSRHSRTVLRSIPNASAPADTHGSFISRRTIRIRIASK